MPIGNYTASQDIVELRPYEDWEFPKVKNEDGEEVEKYKEDLRNVGYKVKTPDNEIIARIQKYDLQRVVLGSNKWKNAVSFIVDDVITDWFDIEPVNSEESLSWDEGKKPHKEFLVEEEQVFYRLVAEYLDRYQIVDKKKDED